MDTACKFTTSVEAFDLSTIGIVNGGVDTDFEAAHGVMQDGGHDGGVVSVRHGKVAAREELVEMKVRHVKRKKKWTNLFAKWIRTGVLGVSIMIVDYIRQPC